MFGGIRAAAAACGGGSRQAYGFASRWRAIAGLAAVAAVLWWLYPSRRLDDARQTEGVVEIVFMGPGGPIQGAMEDVLREFERSSENAHARDPRQPVCRVISGQSAARNQVEDPTRFLVSVAGGTPPDVIFFDRYAVAEWAARGAFEPLDEYIRRDYGSVEAMASRFYIPCWQEGSYKGKVYGIPNSVDNRALYYNKDLLKSAGLVDENGEAVPPRTWRDLKEYAVRLTRHVRPQRSPDSGNITVVGFAPNYGNSWLYMYGWMGGGEFMSADGTRCTLNDPGVVKGLAFMKEVYDALGGYRTVRAFQAGFQGNELDPFIQGKVAMKIDGVWVLRVLATYGRDLDFGVAPNPLPDFEIERCRNEGREPLLSWSGGWAYAIPATARNKDAAWQFINFITSDRAFRILAENDRLVSEFQGRLYMPAQQPVKALNEEFYETYVRNNERLPQRFKDGYRTFNELLPYSRFRPVTPVGQLLWNEHNNATEDALLDKKTPGESLNYHAAVVQTALDRIIKKPAGREITTWAWFFVLYGVLLAGIAAAVYFWDTRRGFRGAIVRLLRLQGRVAAHTIEGSRGGYLRSQWIEGFICAAPWLIGFIAFTGGPMLFSAVMSLCDFDVINPARFIGLDNYRSMFVQDELFPKAVWNTAFMIVGVPLGMAVSLAMALLLNMKIRGMAVWRTFFYLPAIVPMVAGSVLWIWIFNPQGGLLNRLLEVIGLTRLLGVHPLWLYDEATSKPSLILMGLWGAGGGMIIWLAGLKAINQQLYEAASVDGAGELRKFWHITIPQMTPYIFFNLIMGTIGTFQVFGQAFIMTQGGPANSTLFYVYHLFNNAFRYGRMGYAAAMAWFLLAVVLLLTVLQMKLSKRWVYYEAE